MDGHAWNRVILDGKLYNCDLTEDAEQVQQFGIYKKNRPKRVLTQNPKLSKKIMPQYYLKSDKTFSKDHIPYVKQQEEATEDFDADLYYQKDFTKLLKNKFTGLLQSAIKATEKTTRTGVINEQVEGIKAIQRERQEQKEEKQNEENDAPSI